MSYLSRSRHWFSLLALAAMAALPAHAGRFNVALAPDGDVARVQLASAAMTVGAAGQFREFSFVDPTALNAMLTVSLANPTADEAPFTLSVNVPFGSAEADARFDIAAAVVGPFETAWARLNIVSTGSRKLKSKLLADLVLLNQQSRVISRFILNRGTPNPEDAKIILYFVVSSKELVLNHFVEPDNDMMRAAGLLDDFVGEPADLLDADDLQTAADALKGFRQARRAQLLKIALMIDEGIGSDDPDVVTDSCGRAAALDKAVRGMPADARAEADPTRLVAVKALRDRLVCVAPGLTAGIGNDAGLPANMKIASELNGRMTCLLNEYEEGGSSDDPLPGKTRKQQGVIAGMIEYDSKLTGTPVPAPPNCSS